MGFDWNGEYKLIELNPHVQFKPTHAALFIFVKKTSFGPGFVLAARYNYTIITFLNQNIIISLVGSFELTYDALQIYTSSYK